MSPIIAKRILVHAPYRIDLTDLLYYDQVFFGERIGKLLGKNIGEGYIPENINYWLEQGIIPAYIHDKLIEAELIVPSLSGFSTNFVEEYFYHKQFEPARNLWEETKTKFGDETVRILANILRKEGAIVVPKFHSNDFANAFQPGNSEVLSIIFSHLPTLDASYLNINELIDFLKDEETQVKRRRLFAWQNDIELKVEKGEIKIEHVSDLIATLLDEYTVHLKRSKLKFKYGTFEILLLVAANVLSGLTLIKLPDAVKNLLELKKENLNFLKLKYRRLARSLHI
jgi:hypothetical protein